uniref:Uncharacterized protein n=1 Tax=viral metagenome TaxID=1070528 RepID=A0A6C0DBM9_9ZZZZ
MGKFTGLKNSNGSSNGGILGTGIFGMFGSTVNCKDSDNSYYCNFVKFFNFVIMALVLFVIIYFIYTFLKPMLFSKKGR